MPNTDFPARPGAHDSDYDSIDVVAREGLRSSLAAPAAAAPPRALPAAEPPPDPLPEFAGYTLIKKLGAGGMAEVFEATDDATGATVALKVLTAADGEAAVRFEREAELQLVSVVGPQVVKAFRRLPGPRPALVLEYMNGGSLRDFVADGRAKRWTDREIARLVRDITHGVATLHRAGVFHRDLKPDNILMAVVGRALVPKVADLGLAGFREPDRHTQVTTAQRIMGTLAYMAPEQAEGRQATWATDVYGVGAILYELLTGRPPFEAATRTQLRNLVLDAPPTPPAQLRRGVSPRLEAICLKCLAKDPDARYKSIEGLIEALDDFLARERRRRFARAAFVTSLVANAAAALALGVGVDWNPQVLLREQATKLATTAGERDDALRDKADLAAALRHETEGRGKAEAERDAAAGHASGLRRDLAVVTADRDKVKGLYETALGHLTPSGKVDFKDLADSHNKLKAEAADLRQAVKEREKTILARDKTIDDLQSRRVADFETYKGQAGELKAAADARDAARADLTAARAEAAKLATDLAAQKAEVERLKAAAQAPPKAVAVGDGTGGIPEPRPAGAKDGAELEKLRNDLAAAKAEAAKLTTDLAAAKAAATGPPGVPKDGTELAKLKSQLAAAEELLKKYQAYLPALDPPGSGGSRPNSFLSGPAAAGKDGAGRLAITPTELAHHTKSVAAVHVNPSGAVGRSVDVAGTLVTWDLGANTSSGVDLKVAPVYQAAFSADGKRLAVATDHKVVVLDVGSRAVVAEVSAEAKAYERVMLSPDGSRLLVQQQDLSGVRAWEVTAGAAPRRVGQLSSFMAVKGFAPDGAGVLVNDSGAALVRSFTGKDETRLPFGTHTSAYLTWGAFTPSGRYAVTHSSDNITRVWDVAGRKTLTEQLSEGYWYGAFAADGKALVQVNHNRGTVERWDTSDPDPSKWRVAGLSSIRSGGVVGLLPGGAFEAPPLAVSGDGRTVLVAGRRPGALYRIDLR